MRTVGKSRTHRVDRGGRFRLHGGGCSHLREALPAVALARRSLGHGWGWGGAEVVEKAMAQVGRVVVQLDETVNCWTSP